MRSTAQLMIEFAATVGTAGLFGYGFAHWGDAGLGGTVAASIAGGVIGNFADRLMCHGTDLVTRSLSERDLDELPPNHDLARALRRAELHAVMALATASMRENARRSDEYDRSAMLLRQRDATFHQQLRKWVRRARRDNERCQWSPHVPFVISILADQVPELLNEGSEDPRVDAATFAQSAKASLDELKASGFDYLPAPFLEGMNGVGDSSVPAWDVALRSYFWEEIKTRTAVHRVVSLRMMLPGGRGGFSGLGGWRVSRA
jgi:hypothetical protein